jgi:hypothetical protein
VCAEAADISCHITLHVATQHSTPLCGGWGAGGAGNIKIKINAYMPETLPADRIRRAGAYPKKELENETLLRRIAGRLG